MVRAIAMSAVSALCLVWAAGCASTGEHVSKATAAPAATTDATSAADAKLAALTKGMPDTLDGEILRAQDLRTKGDYDEAARSFAQLLLVAPDDARVVAGYGKVLEQQGHSQEALAFLKRAADINPQDWSTQSALGIAYDQVDNHASARTAYERALALKPGDATVLNNYAVSQMLAGNYASAQRLFAAAEAKGVSNPKIALNLEKLSSLNTGSAAGGAASQNAAADTAPASSGAATPAPVTVANLGAPAAQSMPAATPAQSAPAIAARTANAAPKDLTTAVVMQPVPSDQLAGRVKHRVHPAQKLASTSHQPAKPVAAKPAAPAAPPPALRTATGSD